MGRQVMELARTKLTAYTRIAHLLSQNQSRVESLTDQKALALACCVEHADYDGVVRIVEEKTKYEVMRVVDLRQLASARGMSNYQSLDKYSLIRLMEKYDEEAVRKDVPGSDSDDNTSTIRAVSRLEYALSRTTGTGITGGGGSLD